MNKLFLRQDILGELENSVATRQGISTGELKSKEEETDDFIVFWR